MNKLTPKSVRTFCTISDNVLPPDCPESIKEWQKGRFGTLNENPAGSISSLKKGGRERECLANWKDQFVKDIYLSPLCGYTLFKQNHTEKFIYHKLQVLRDDWSRINSESVKEREIPIRKVDHLDGILSSEKERELWDWCFSISERESR